MNSKLLNCHWSWATVICLLGLAVQSANGQSQNVYFVGKTQAFTQSDSSGAIADTSAPFQFSATAYNPAMLLVLPSGSTRSMTYSANNQDYEINQNFTTKIALDAAWPNGTYKMTGSGAPPTSFNLTPDSYPASAPQVTGGTWNNGLLVVNPGQAVTINLSTFTGYATSGVAGHMSVEVGSAFGGNTIVKNDIATQSVFGLTGTTTPLTAISIPAAALTSGQLYQGHVSWDTLTTLDVPNTAVALFEKQLNFYIAAQTPGTFTQLPVITSQPTNQSGIVGGNATFTLGVTVNGSGNTGNLVTDWYFNGGNINVDGTKYSWPNNTFGLIVNNLTAADAGSYSVRLGNAGGFVTSSSATLTIAAAAAPSITSQPVSQTISSGSTVVFSVAATGVPTPIYQWRNGSNNISGATSATLVLSGPTGATAALAGNYSCWATNSLGTAASNTAALTVITTNNPGRLINLSVLTDISAAVPSFTVGTVIGPSGVSGTKALVVRAAGPSLGALGVPGTIGDPQLTLFNSNSVSIAVNNDWGGGATLLNAMASVGAFAFTGPSSLDAATYQPSLAPGGYTVIASGNNGSVGTAIAEIYDATPAGTFTPSSPRLINVSVNKPISAGGYLTLGFTIGGSTARTVLIRVIGPGLTIFGYPTSSVLGDPQLTLYDRNSQVIATNDDWGADSQLSTAGSRVGAFSIGNTATKDSMLLITLPVPPPEGAGYSVKATGNANTSGQAIVEVYEVP